MKIFNDLLMKFEKPDWSANPEFCVIDTILESRPDIILILKSDIIGNEIVSTFGRQDTPSVEQIVPTFILAQNSPTTKVFSEDETIKHYWYYRERLKYFVHPGPNIGEGQVAGIRNSMSGRIFPDPITTEDLVKNVGWGQHNIYFGYYLGVLATEYYLLGAASNSTQ